MKMQAKFVSVVGVAVIVCALGVALAQSKKEPVFVESEKAEFKEIAPGSQEKDPVGQSRQGALRRLHEVRSRPYQSAAYPYQ